MLSQRRIAAALAMAERFEGDNLSALTFPPALPPLARPGTVKLVSSASPVAIRIIWTAFPMTSAGRFCPEGPFGMTSNMAGHPALGKRGRFQTDTLPILTISIESALIEGKVRQVDAWRT